MLEKIKDIPTLPQVTLELIRHAFEEEPDIRILASIIEREPTLTAKLFKTVNSAAFGLKAEVKNVQQATSIMGIETLRATIISIAMGDYFLNNAFGKALDPRNFCLHSLATGAIMREIAQKMGLKISEQLYLVGLLHDLGKLVLDTLPAGRYDRVLDLVGKGQSFEAAERAVFGFDNTQVWQHLAKTWNFPSEIVALYTGTLEGKAGIPVRSFTEDASRTAESLGYCLVKPSLEKNLRKIALLSLLDDEKLDGIGPAIQKQVEIINEILDLPLPNQAEIFQNLFRISRQLSVANTRYKKVHRELKNRVEVLEDLTRVFTGIIKSLHGDSLAFSVLEALIEGFGVSGAALLNYEDNGDFSGYAALDSERGEPGVYRVQIRKDQISPSMAACLESQSPVKVMNPSMEPVLRNFLGDVGMVWLAPIVVRTRFTSILGLGIMDPNDRKFNNEDFVKIFDIVAGEVGLSLENIRLYHRVKQEARTDPLTSISNRRTIMKVLNSEFARFKRKGIPVSAAILDMDHFKSINDNRGHLAGDEFLSRIAEILKRGVRESDYVGRFGGDEFMAVFPDTPAEEAFIVIERIRKMIMEYCTSFGGSDLPEPLSVSIGLAGADERLNRPDELIQFADAAMYRAKNSGRNRCVMHRFDPAPATT